jgi:hypothetical protein
MEIGQIVTWKVANKNYKGIFKHELNSELSEVRCTEIDGKRFILTVQVLTNILESHE